MAAIKCDIKPIKDHLSGNRRQRTKKNRKSLSKHVIRKRIPPRFPRSGKDIWVTKKSDFKAQLNRCSKLIYEGESDFVIHGLGAAIPRACKLALVLKEIHHGTVDIDINTSTVDIIDDFEPITDDADYEVNRRKNSAIHIRIFQTGLIGTMK